MENLKEILESILFVAGDSVAFSDIAEKLQLDVKEVENTFKEMKQEREEKGSGIQVLVFNGKAQLCSNPNYANQVAEVLNPIKEKALTKAVLEVCAIVAYKQPITRLEIENVRGVNSDYAINALVENNLIEIVGRKDAVGKPLLFGTTDNFLKKFGLSNIDELPDYNELLERIQVLHNPDQDGTSLFNFRDTEDEITLDEMKKQELMEQKADIDIDKLKNEILNDKADVDNLLDEKVESDYVKFLDEENWKMLLMKHFFLLLANTKYMKTVLFVVLILIILITFTLDVGVKINYNILKNIGEVELKLFGIKVFSGEISIIAGYFNFIRKNKKVIQIKVDLSDKNFRFVKDLSDNFKQRIYLKNFGSEFVVCSKSAKNVSILAGNLNIINGYVSSRLLADNSDTAISSVVLVGYLNEYLWAEIKATIYVCIFDVIWAFLKAIWQRRVYGKA